MPGSPFATGGAGTGRRLARRAPSSEPPTAGSCSRSTPAATRSRCCASSAGGKLTRGRRSPVCVARQSAGQHHGARPPRVRRQRRRRRQQLHRLPPGSRGHADAPAAARPSRCPTARSPGDVLFNATGTKLAGTRVGTLADRQLRGARERPAAGGAGIAVRGAGPRPVRQRVPADQAVAAVRLERPRRHRQRHRLGLPGGGQRRAVLDRGIAVPRPPDGAVLGRDQRTTAATCSPSTPPCRASRATASASGGGLHLLGSTGFNSSAGSGTVRRPAVARRRHAVGRRRRPARSAGSASTAGT